MEKLKYFFLYCYEAAEKMEQKAAAFHEQRRERMEAFRRERQAAEDKAKQKIDEIKGDVRQYVKDTVSDIGLATRDEIQELKGLVADLAKKVDTLAKK